jgi:hypothetical protein
MSVVIIDRHYKEIIGVTINCFSSSGNTWSARSGSTKKWLYEALLKVDIAKAFDSVNWSFLLDLLSHTGFTRHWINWVSILLSTASTKILLNSQPGHRICHAPGHHRCYLS